MDRDDTTHCDPKTKTCVACIASSDCVYKTTEKVCDPANGICVACLGSSDCTYASDKPICDATANTCVGCLKDGVGCKGGWHEQDARIGSSLLHRVLHGIEYRPVQVGLSTLARRNTADHIGAVFDHLGGVEGAFRSGESLDDDAGILVDENAHGVVVAYGVMAMGAGAPAQK